MSHVSLQYKDKFKKKKKKSKRNYKSSRFSAVFLSPSEWPCAFVYNEAGEKSIHGAVDNVIRYYDVYVYVVLKLRSMI